MAFSELKLIAAETGLDWDEERLSLCGEINGYPVFLSDIPEKKEYLLTVFCRVRKETDKSVADGITALLEKLPRNSVNGRVNELKYQQLRFNAVLLYQENLALLAQFVKELTALLDSFDLLPEQSDDKTAFPVRSAEPVKPVKKPRPKDSVSKRFDKYSLRGTLAAFIGAAAMAVLSGIIIGTDDGSVGSMIGSWAAGALIAFVTLADYRFLAGKIDIFGNIVCTVFTALACVGSSLIGTVRIMESYARLIDPSADFFGVIANWPMYSMLFSDRFFDFALMILKSLFTALLATALFYTIYYRRHSAIMYSDGEDFIPKS